MSVSAFPSPNKDIIFQNSSRLASFHTLHFTTNLKCRRTDFHTKRTFRLRLGFPVLELVQAGITPWKGWSLDVYRIDCSPARSLQFPNLGYSEPHATSSNPRIKMCQGNWATPKWVIAVQVWTWISSACTAVSRVWNGAANRAFQKVLYRILASSGNECPFAA